MTNQLDKKQVVGTLAANFDNCVEALIHLSHRRCAPISAAVAEEVAAEALWSVPMRLPLLKHYQIVDDAILSAWLAEFSHNKKKRRSYRNAH